MMESLRLIVAHGSETTRGDIERGVIEGHEILASVGTVRDLHAAVARERPQLILSGLEFADGGGIAALVEISREAPIPAVIVTARRSLEMVEEAMRDHVLAYLIEPVSREELEAAIVIAWSRYLEFRELSDRVADLEQALRDRKIIERAKGALMAAGGLSEAEAFALLRTRSQDRRTRLADVAQEVLDGAWQGGAPPLDGVLSPKKQQPPAASAEDK